MKRIFLTFTLAIMLGLTGCGDGAKEAKELLQRILNLVGIPHSIVVNICQDDNDNGFCESTELQAKLTINEGDTVESIFKKLQFEEDGSYILRDFDPTKKILLEIVDNDSLKNSNQEVTLAYNPIKDVKEQELSILQSLIDANLLKEEEIRKLKESDKRSLVDKILLENIFQNQSILVENNVTKKDATKLNLEYIAEGLRDINISGNFIDELEGCENNSTCEEELIKDTNQQTEINEEEAKVISDTNSTEGTGDRDTILTSEEDNSTIAEDDNTTSEDENTTSEDDNSTSEDENTTSEDDSNTNDEKTTKNGADGYIVKLSSPAKAFCGGITYESDLVVGDKGLITFTGVTLPDNCHIFIPEGATIDSNNNGVLDATDKVLNFSMKGPSDASFISPLTTLLLEKEANGEDVTEFKKMVKDFDPVASAMLVNSNVGIEKTKIQKLMTLMEVLKTTLKDGESSILDINISSVVTTNNNDTFKEFDVSSMLGSLSSTVKTKAEAKAQTMQDIMRLTDTIDNNTIDLNTFIINISDGEMDIVKAFKASVKASVTQAKKDEIQNATTIDTLIKTVIKSSYNSNSIVSISNYFSSIQSNLISIYSGDFNIVAFDINTTQLQSSRSLEFINTNEIDKVVLVYSLDELTEDDHYYYDSASDQKKIKSSVNYINYDSRYEKAYDESESNNFKIKTNHVAKFEIIEGLDSKFFQISQGNRDIAYIDLKDDMESPTADTPEDLNNDGIYEVEIKATDVQMLESKKLLLRFKIKATTDTKADLSPFFVERGYITKFAAVGGLVLDRNSNYSWHQDIETLIHLNSSFPLASMELNGEGSDDFEIVDNKRIKVTNTLDYETKPLYNLTVVATDDAGTEYNQTLTIEVTNDTNRTIEFLDRATLEKVARRVSLSKNGDDDVDYLHLHNNSPAKFKIVEGLDKKFFTNYEERSSSDSWSSDYSWISNYSWIEHNKSLTPSYKSKDDINADGIYEVNVSVTDVQTLEQNNILLKYKLVSSYLNFNNYYREDRETQRNFSFSLPRETVVGGEVPYSLFTVAKAQDVNITEISLEGNSSEDFNISNNAITVAQAIDENRSNYNLKIVMKDSTGATFERNITIDLYSMSHDELTITNMSNLHLNQYATHWWNFSSQDIYTNNIARMRLLGADSTLFNYNNNNRHSNSFYIDEYYDYKYDEQPTYLNPKDSDKDNIYEFQAEFKDIQTLEKKYLNYTYEMLSHQVRPYWAYQSNTYYYSNSLESNLTIPAEAPVGGEVLTIEGAKGFYPDTGRDISISEVSLEGTGADKFKIEDNTITIKESLNKNEEYNLTLVVNDSEAQESRNPLYIHVGTIFSGTPAPIPTSTPSPTPSPTPTPTPSPTPTPTSVEEKTSRTVTNPTPLNTLREREYQEERRVEKKRRYERSILPSY